MGDGSVYREITAENVYGSPTVASLGGGLLTDTRSYRASTGELTEIQTTKSGAALRQLDYQTDVYGNVLRQTLNSGATVESYSYDPLQRMIQATRTGAVSNTITYAYDAAGNFISKSDFSTTAANAYTYTGGGCGGGPNAVKSVITPGGTRNYCYDADGNLTSDSAGLQVKYDHDNLAFQTTRGASTIYLAYGPDNQRTRQWGTDGTKVYVDGYEDWISAGTSKVYVGGDAVITTTATSRTVNYLLTDRLGSVDSVADSTGTLIETRGSDSFGKPRTGTWADTSPARLQSTAITEHGFTGHEHLNSVELIHMNGRVYDYALGRFLSVDPFIQFPLNSQSLNPYSYLLNNPLAGKDPTGYLAVCDTFVVCSQDQINDPNYNKQIYISGDGKKDNGQQGQGAKPSTQPTASAPAGTTASSSATGPLGFFRYQDSGSNNQPKFLGEIGMDDVEGPTFANGILSDQERHAYLGAAHLAAEFQPMPQAFDLINIPSHHFLSDIWRTFRDKIGWATPEAREMARVFEDAQKDGRHIGLVAHSGAGPTVVMAIRIAYSETHAPLSDLSVNFHGGANNAFVTNSILCQSGVSLFGGINGSGYRRVST